MTFLFDSFFASESPYKQASKKAFESFLKSPFSLKEEKPSLEKIKKIADFILDNKESVFVFGFGGSSMVLDILQKTNSIKNKKTFLIDSFDEKILAQIASLPQEKLRKSHWVFISKSGNTFELVFYSQWLKKIYSKNNISLDKKISFFTFEKQSLLLDWFQKNKANIYFLQWPLSGRFSFFSEIGKLQFFLSGMQPSSFEEVQKRCQQGLPQIEDLLQFFFFQLKKFKNQGEIYLLSSGTLGESLAFWFEKLWMESFCQHSKNFKITSLRASSFLDFTHFYLQDLVTHKNYKWLWGLEIEAPYFLSDEKVFLRKFLKFHKIPNFFMSFSKNNLSTLEDNFFIFYSLLYGISHWLELDIFNQKYVDEYKNFKKQIKI